MRDVVDDDYSYIVVELRVSTSSTNLIRLARDFTSSHQGSLLFTAQRLPDFWFPAVGVPDSKPCGVHSNRSFSLLCQTTRE
jgi:hypothetical protein